MSKKGGRGRRPMIALSLFLRASRTPLSIVFFSGRYVSANAFVSNKSICSFGISFACDFNDTIFANFIFFSFINRN
uniref:Uncharacterized protein n=1 Tax=Solanum lycopersicum TaxID=4081 RepID=A0A3Q7GK08_SOLLC